MAKLHSHSCINAVSAHRQVDVDKQDLPLSMVSQLFGNCSV